MVRFGIPLALISLILAPHALNAKGHYYNPHDDRAVELSTIQSLIFRKDSMSTGRRASPVPQLTCVGGGACGGYGEPTVVHCTNIGTDYANGDPTWKCTAELENGLRLGTTDVVCEGFRDREDPYILRGSCGLEYTLLGSPVRSQQAQQQQNREYSSQGSGSYQSNYKPYTGTYSAPSSRGSWFKWILGGFFLWMFLRYLNKPARAAYRHSSHQTPGSNGGETGNFNGGWGNWGNWGNWGGQGRGFFGDGDKYNNNAGRGGGTGFWQGLGLGTAAGYLFGGRNNNNGGWFQRANNYGANTGAYNPGTGYGGGTYGRPAPPPPYAPHTTDTGPATQTATGYGNTRRRG